MVNPQVSIILPTYNRSRTLPRAIRSILAQTFREFELIVVDDGSTDDTESVVRSFNDSRLTYVKQDHSGSASIARNTGINSSSCPLLAFQDSDDEWLVDKLECQMLALKNSPDDTGLICGGYLILAPGSGARYVGAKQFMRLGEWNASNIYDFHFITPTWLVKRSVMTEVGSFDDELSNLEDWELIFRLFKKCKIIALDCPLVVKHGSADSINASPSSRIPSLERIIHKHGEIWRDHPGVLAKLHEELGRWQCRHGSIQSGRRNFLKSLKFHPYSMKRWLLCASTLLGKSVYIKLFEIRKNISI